MFPSSPFSDGAVGGSGAAFLKLVRSTRESALGGAASANAQGSDALFSNPAGLASLVPESPADLSLTYDNLLETSYLGTAAWGRPLGVDGALGADVAYFSQGAMTSYSGLGDNTGSFRPYDLAASIAYAHRFKELALGGKLKLIRSVLSDVSGASAAIDFGAQLKSVFLLGDRPVDAGAHISNLGPPIKLGSVAAPLPFAVAGGVVWHMSKVADSLLEVHLPSDQAPYVSLGVEAAYRFDGGKRSAALRLGYDQSHGRELGGAAGLAAGGGLDLGSLRLDYAWVPYGDLGMQNRITLGLRF